MLVACLFDFVCAFYCFLYVVLYLCAIYILYPLKYENFGLCAIYYDEDNTNKKFICNITTATK